MGPKISRSGMMICRGCGYKEEGVLVVVPIKPLFSTNQLSACPLNATLFLLLPLLLLKPLSVVNTTLLSLPPLSTIMPTFEHMLKVLMEPSLIPTSKMCSTVQTRRLWRMTISPTSALTTSSLLKGGLLVISFVVLGGGPMRVNVG